MIKNPQKKIVIDARMYGLEHAGIGRYVINLISNFNPPAGGQISNFKIILLVRKDKLAEFKKEFGNRFEYVSTGSRHYSFFEQIEIPLILWKLKPDLIHFLHFNVPVCCSLAPKFTCLGRYVVTIHDLIKHYFRGIKTTTRTQWLYWIKYLAYQLTSFLAIKRARLIFTPCNYWKKDLIKRFKIDKEKVIVTYEAVAPDFLELTKESKPLRDISRFYDLPANFFVYTGSVYPHKNLESLLRAMTKTKNLGLAVICSRNIFTKRVEEIVVKLKLTDRVKFLGFISDRELVVLYRQAIALVQPSLMEGFGLTGLEAMAVGCPVVSSNASCLPEVYGNAAVYFNPLDIGDIRTKLLTVEKDETLRKILIFKGKDQVKKYSWAKMAEETLTGYERILENKTYRIYKTCGSEGET